MPKINPKSRPRLTPNSKDAIDGSGSEDTSVTNSSEATCKAHQKSDTNNTISSKLADAFESGVAQLSQNNTVQAFRSFLEQIKTDCNELLCIVDGSMVPNTKSLIDFILPQLIKDVMLSDKEFENKEVTSDTHQPLGTGSNPPNQLNQEFETVINCNGEIKSPQDTHSQSDINISDVFVDEKRKQNRVTSLKLIPGKLCFLCKEVATLGPCEKCIKNKVLPKEEIPAYCGPAHKDLHWTSGHDKCCGKKALKLGWKEVQGTEGINNGLPYYVATRELEPGYYVFTKNVGGIQISPLLTFPKRIDESDLFAYCAQFSQLEPYLYKQGLGVHLCIVCNEFMVYGEIVEDPLYGIRLNKCPTCGWPVHSPPPGMDDQKLSMNFCQEKHKKECKVFTDNNLTWDKITNHESLFLYLGPLRAVLDPVLRQKLLKLPVPSRRENFEAIRKFVKEDCKQDQVSDEELDKIIYVIWSNSLPSCTGFFSIREKHCFTIYEGGHTGRIFPHSCNPNCSIHVNPKTGVATFKTRRKVKEDEMLTINYLGDVFPKPIHQRALSLMSYAIDHCGCDKCKDGEDVTSAMKRLEGAKKHKRGCTSKYLMPYSARLQEKGSNKPQENSFESEEGTSTSKEDLVDPHTSNLYFWQCQSCKSHGSRMEQAVVQQQLVGIREELKGAFRGLQYDELKEIIRKYSDVEVHPEHSIMLLAHVALGYLVVSDMRMVDISADENELIDVYSYLSDFDNVIKMLKKTENGRSEIYGTLLYYHTLLEMSRLAQKLSNRRKKHNCSETQTSLESINNNLKESWEIMKDNPYLSAFEINRDIYLFELYSKDLEFYAQVLFGCSPGSVFKSFRTKQAESLKTALASPKASWYLCKVKSEGNDDCLKRMKQDVCQSGEIEEGSMVKIELQENVNKISGALMREMLLLIN